MWKLTVTAGRYAEGRVRREHRTIRAASELQASRELAAFVTEVHESPPVPSSAERVLTVDAAIEQFLTEHLLGEKGREAVESAVALLDEEPRRSDSPATAL